MDKSRYTLQSRSGFVAAENPTAKTPNHQLIPLLKQLRESRYARLPLDIFLNKEIIHTKVYPKVSGLSR
jgi:hypothetical protein